MWWTQPKLALIILALNGCVMLVLGLLMPASTVRTAAIIGAQTVLMVAYVATARRLGTRHLGAATRAAFHDRIWNRSWGPRADGFEYLASHEPQDTGGASFYRHVLGSTSRGYESLYGALSLWEGSRLLWSGETVSVALALASGTLMLEVTARTASAGLTATWLAAWLLPACVLHLPEAVKLLLLKRRLLRRGTVAKVAALTPRDAVDFGLQAEEPVLPADFRRDVAWTSVAFLAVPVIVVAALATGPQIAAVGAAALAGAGTALVALFYGFRWFVVHRIPFITFAGPMEVSVVLDMAHRLRAWFGFGMLWGLAYVVMEVSFGNDPGDLPPLWFTLYWLGFISAITFGDQLAGYAGFGSARRFEACLDRSMAKLRAGAP